MSFKINPLFIIALIILLITIACSFSSPFNSSPTQTKIEPTFTLDSENDEEVNEASGHQADETENGADDTILDLDGYLIVPMPEDRGACANVLFPLHPGMEWVYSLDNTYESSQISLAVSKVDRDQATLIIQDLQSGHDSETTVYCQDGAILNFPLFFFGSFMDGGDGTFNLSYVDGYYVPNYITFHKNEWRYQWASSYLASGTINTQFNGRSIAANLQESPVTITWRIPETGGVLFSPTQVVAGNFPDAIKLAQVIELDFTANFNSNEQNSEIAGVLTLEAQLWFQPNLGLLKHEVTQVSANLFGVNLPIEFNSSSELVSFKGE